jgi:hypothetical protein
MLVPKLSILPTAQRRLWDQLGATPDSFALYGGTALALRLGHRNSIDFDFFCAAHFKTDTLRSSIAYLAGAVTQQDEPNTLKMLVDRGGPVQVSFFGVPKLGQIEPHDRLERPGVNVASLIDLAGTKAAVIYRRAEPKDYIDIHALLTISKISLADMLAAACTLYGPSFVPLISLKAISHHEDAALASLPLSLRRDLASAVTAVDPGKLPIFTPIRTAGGRP